MEYYKLRRKFLSGCKSNNKIIPINYLRYYFLFVNIKIKSVLKRIQNFYSLRVKDLTRNCKYYRLKYYLML